MGLNRQLPVWPKTNRSCRPSGTLRTYLNDFRVWERRSEGLAGEGEHLYLQIQKTNVTTTIVQNGLARYFKVPVVDVSYAGLKDRRAVATQWFSVRLPQKKTDLIDGIQIEGCSIVDSSWHYRKLRRGNLDGNDFEIVVRNVEGPVEEGITQLVHGGFPNYFGPQRFGNKGNNICEATEWIQSRRPKVSRLKRSVFISTLRSVLFNDVLGERVRKRSWNKMTVGDELMEGLPTGPLWGRGRPLSKGPVFELEKEVARRRSDFCDALEWVGLSQQRRSLVGQVSNFQFSSNKNIFVVRFGLRSGSYANVALSEIFNLAERKE